MTALSLSFRTDISTALKQLEEIIGIPRRQQRPTIVPPLPNGAPKSDRIKQPQTCLRATHRQINKIQDLDNQALIQYLLKRGIERKTAAPYVKEIYYSLMGKEYFALAFPNLSGGYELRNPYFQGTLGKKDISLGSIVERAACPFKALVNRKNKLAALVG